MLLIITVFHRRDTSSDMLIVGLDGRDARLLRFHHVLLLANFYQIVLHVKDAFWAVSQSSSLCCIKICWFCTSCSVSFYLISHRNGFLLRCICSDCQGSTCSLLTSIFDINQRWKARSFRTLLLLLILLLAGSQRRKALSFCTFTGNGILHHYRRSKTLLFILIVFIFVKD